MQVVKKSRAAPDQHIRKSKNIEHCCDRIDEIGRVADFVLGLTLYECVRDLPGTKKIKLECWSGIFFCIFCFVQS